MNSKTLKIGLVGAGVFGGYHANKLAAHGRTDFVGVFDPDQERSALLAENHRVEAFESAPELFGVVGAGVIAGPAIY